MDRQQTRIVEQADSGRLVRLFVALALLALLLPGLTHGIWRPDEPRVAGICAQMARSGDFCVPRLNGEPFLEKPPLYFACAALAGRLGDPASDLPYRIVSLLFAAGTLALVWLMGRRRGEETAGLLSALVLGSAWQFFRIARWIQVDIALVFGVTLCLYAWLGLRETGRRRDAVLFGLGLGLAFMAKGLVGPAIVAGAVLADLLISRDWRLVLRARPIVVLAVLCLSVVPWIWGLYVEGGWPFVREVLVVNNLMRFTGAPEGAALGHQHGPLYYLDRFPRDFLPWTFVFIPALVASLRDWRKDPFLPWFAGPFVLLCLSSTKRGVYLVPLYPAAAWMIGRWLAHGPVLRWERVLVSITWGVAALGCVLPVAGAAGGQAVLGICLAVVATGFLVVVRRTPGIASGLALALVVCVAMGAAHGVYYPMMQPREDYLPATRQVLAEVGDESLTIVCPEEILEGMLPLATGRTFAEAATPEEVTEPGYYVWVEKRDRVLRALEKQGGMTLVSEQQLGSRRIRLARLAGPASETATRERIDHE